MSGKPPSGKKPKVPLSTLLRQRAALEFALGNEDKSYDLSMASSKALKEEMKESDRRTNMYIKGPTTGIAWSKGGKTRRRRRGGGSENVWDVVQQVCLALGLRTCPLGTPSPSEKVAVEEINPPRFDEWGPPPESPEEEIQSFSFGDPGKPPLCPKVARRLPESEMIKKEALYLRDVARNIHAKGDRKLAERFMQLAKEAYARSCATKEIEKKTTPLEKIGIAEKREPGQYIGAPRKGGKTRRRGKSKK